jgi:cytochrome d ubiquinol oxidase subunit II
MTTVVAIGLLLGVMAYALFGGADFGAGFWDLTAGGGERGRRPRALIDHAIGPVWEANHTWLIYCLVVTWTGFPTAFAAIMTTLYLPLGFAVLGIVIRGSGFAFRKALVHTDYQRVNGAAFALSSVITPFFFGAVIGGIASGRVPAAGHGDSIRSWVNPSSLLTGGLAVAICAYLAAVFLTVDAQRRGEQDLQRWSRRRAWIAAWLAGAFAVADLAGSDNDAHRLFTHLTGRALPLTIISALAGALALALMRRGGPRLIRTLASVAVAALVAGWGVAQYPYLLGTHTSLTDAAAPSSSLTALVVVFAAAAVIVAPSITLLYRLQQRGQLENG